LKDNKKCESDVDHITTIYGVNDENGKVGDEDKKYSQDPPMTATREEMSSFFIFWSMWSKRAPISLMHRTDSQQKSNQNDRTNALT
jgi:hypothetical protein